MRVTLVLLLVLLASVVYSVELQARDWEFLSGPRVNVPDTVPQRLVFETPNAKRQNLPMIKIGSSHTAYGPVSGSGNLQFQALQMFLNMSRTYTIAGVTYGIQFISYLDDQQKVDGATSRMIVDTLVQRDKVHLLVSSYGGNTMTDFIPAAEAQPTPVPCINVGAYEFSFQNQANFPWTVSTLPSINSLGLACSTAYAQKGAKTFAGAYGSTAGIAVVGIVNTAFITAGFTPIGNDTTATKALFISDDKFAKPELLDPIIRDFKKLDPDVLVVEFGHANGVIFVDRMRQNNYNPRGLMVWGVASYPLFREALGWKEAFTAVSEAYSPYLKSPDPLWGSTDNYNTLFFNAFNSTTANADANFASGLTVLDAALRATPDLAPGSLRSALLGVNIPTIVGPMSFTGRTVNRELYCFQMSSNASTILTTWPPTALSYVNMTYPAIVPYPAGYFDSLQPDRTLQRVLTITFGTLGGVLFVLVVGGVLFYLWWTDKYHTVAIPKSATNTEWGSARAA